MLKRTLILFLIIFSVLINAQEIPDALAEYINEIKVPVEYKEIPVIDWNAKIPDMITKDQALEDLNMFEYIFTTSYSGYDYWINKTVDFEKAFKNMRDEVLTFGDTFETWKLEKSIVVNFYDLGIKDGHLSVKGYKYNNFFSHKDAYFTNILLKKRGNKYIVVDSAAHSVEKGDIYTDDKKYLFNTLSPNGKEYFIIGSLSEESIFFKKIKFSSGDKKLIFHRCHIGEADVSSEVFEERKVLNIPVISVRTFNSNYHNALKNFEEAGKKYRDSQNLIIDALYNGGGSSDYAKNFMLNLNDKAIWRKAFAYLEAPASIQTWANLDVEESSPYLKEYILEARKKLKEQKKNPYRMFHVYDVPDMQYGSFKGNLFVLTNKNIASSGEALCSYAKTAKNTLLVGENTAGIGTFGEIDHYQLPNSKIITGIPEKLFVQPDSVEGRGFLPDIWLDSNEPVKELVQFIKFPDTYMFSYSEKAPKPLVDIDFENWEDNIPVGLSLSIGATTGNGDKNKIEKYKLEDGTYCLKITGDINTGVWRSLSRKIPDGLKKITVKYTVKAEELKKEANQFNNVYIGFIYYNNQGQRKFSVKPYNSPENSTFDWKEDSHTLYDKGGIYNATFNIFSSISGSFYIDDLKFETEDM